MAKKATSNFLRENNARQVWHPMAHPNEMDATPPRIIVSGKGCYVTDIDGKRVVVLSVRRSARRPLQAGDLRI